MASPCSLLTVGLIFAAAPIFAAESAIPQRPSLERYQDLHTDSPFAVATTPAPPPPPPPEVFANLYITSMTKDYDADGKEAYFVGVRTRGEETSFSLYGTAEGHDGFSIGSVQWSDEQGKSKVTLKKGSEFGEIKFDPQVIQAPVGGGVPPPPQRPQGGPGMNGMNGRPLPRPPGSSVPRPSVPAVLPSAFPAPSPSPGRDGNTTAPTNRQRVRVIKANP